MGFAALWRRERSSDQHAQENEPMNAYFKLVFALVIGVSIGVVGAEVIRAQQAKAAPGYVIAEVEVTNPVTMQKYVAGLPATLAPFNHHYVVLDSKPQTMEGEPAKGIVIIAFESVEKAREWYDSPAYAAVKPLRLSAAKTRLLIAEGVAPQ
jgi:uncharacterized protein (DUF1330 family)